MTLLITLSTWIRTLAMCRVSSNSKADSWFFPFVNAGMCSLASCARTPRCQTPYQQVQRPLVRAYSRVQNVQLGTCH